MLSNIMPLHSNPLRRCFLLLVFVFGSYLSFGATWNFNKLYKGTGSSYAEQSQSITGLTSITGTNFTFTQNGVASFTGNSIDGVLTYTDSNSQTVTIYINLNRRDKTGTTSHSFYGVVYTTSSYNVSTGEAFLLVVPGNENLYSENGSATTSSDPIDSALNAVVASTPSITATGTTLNAFTTCQGTASTAQSFTVSASSLTANLVVTAPTGYEVSWSAASGYAASISATPSSGTVSSRSVYVRLKGTSAGSVTGNVTVTSTNANTVTVPVSGTVSALPTISTSAGQTISAPGQVSLTATASSGTVKWYSNSTGGTSLYTGSPYVTNVTITTNFYVEAVDGSCVSSSRTQVTATVAAPGINAIADSFSGINGSNGGTTTSVLANDLLNGLAATTSNVTLTTVTTPPTGLTLNSDGTITVAPGTAAGTYQFTYKICETANLTNCDQNTVSVTVNAAVIDAVADSFSGINGSNGGTTTSVLANDLLNGSTPTTSNVTLTGLTVPTGLTLNANGTITVAAGKAAGTYQVIYKICEILNPTNCDTDTASVTVGAAVIDAVNDSFGPLNGQAGGTSASVLANDTLNGSAATTSNVTLTGLTVPTGFTLNTDGTITVAAGTAAGTYTITYKICQNLNPNNCDQGSVTYTIVGQAIDAINDTRALSTYSATTGSVTTNDTGGTITVTQASIAGVGSVTLGQATTIPNVGTFTINSNGSYTFLPLRSFSGTVPTITYTASNTFATDTATLIMTFDGDSDGDGVPDSLDPAPNDPCVWGDTSNRAYATSTAWNNADCDGDGTPNGTDTNPLDFCVGGAVPAVVPTLGSATYDTYFRNGDCDGDGISNHMETNISGLPIDTDGDGTPNYLDTDSDNDGIPDYLEGNIDTDKDGIADYQDLDSDNDGIGDREEGYVDTDGDGIKDYVDLDSDNDNIKDAWEAPAVFELNRDDNYDGRIDKNGVFIDSNGNGWGDIADGLRATDTDGDGIADYKDLDSDNDCIPDSIELTNDTDSDFYPNFRDKDSDGDGIPDLMETSDCSSPIDTDKDGKPDYLDLDSDNDGIPDTIEKGTDGNNPVDTDKDGTPDYRDLDSDNDGIPDTIEKGADGNNPLDTDKDGTPDYRDLDSDNDGIPDTIEKGADGNNPVDTDKDGTPDYRDLDSDNDGIPDTIEKGADGNNPVDTDKDGTPDYRDLDSDNDGIPDTIEKGTDGNNPVDTDKDGTPDFRDLDSDNDGIPDTYEKGADGNNPLDTDKDGIPDYRDIDSDNDGIPDVIEAGADPNNPVDTDKDGTPDFRDLDSDNDGIPDTIEKGTDGSNPVDTDKDGIPDYRDLDSDNDGIPDTIEKGADGNNPVDTDKDGTPDFRDLDSDNDGIPDAIERGPNGNNPVDTDKDGIPDFRDTDSDNDSIPDTIEKGTDGNNPVDTDKDGTPDFRDLDSDNDGISDQKEAGTNGSNPVDTDKDGIPDFRDIDSDNDGITDANENNLDFGNIADCDGDGIENRIDPDGCEVYTTQGISPNGDGRNDKLVIPGVMRYNNKLTIFNRWGDVVYEKENYRNDWGGEGNAGTKILEDDGLLPDGTYYYVVDFYGVRPSVGSFIFINRTK